MSGVPEVPKFALKVSKEAKRVETITANEKFLEALDKKL